MQRRQLLPLLGVCVCIVLFRTFVSQSNIDVVFVSPTLEEPHSPQMWSSKEKDAVQALNAVIGMAMINDGWVVSFLSNDMSEVPTNNYPGIVLWPQRLNLMPIFNDSLWDKFNKVPLLVKHSELSSSYEQSVTWFRSKQQSVTRSSHPTTGDIIAADALVTLLDNNPFDLLLFAFDCNVSGSKFPLSMSVQERAVLGDIMALTVLRFVPIFNCVVIAFDSAMEQVVLDWSALSSVVFDTVIVNKFSKYCRSRERGGTIGLLCCSTQ